MDNLNNVNRNNNQIMSTVVAVIVSLFVLYIFYKIYNFYTSKKVTTKIYKDIVEKSRNGKEEIKVTSSEIPTSSYSNEYSISMWLLINNYDYKLKQRKHVLTRGKKDGENANPEITLEPLHNDLTVKIKLQSYSKENFSNTNDNNNSLFEKTEDKVKHFENLNKMMKTVNNTREEGKTENIEGVEDVELYKNVLEEKDLSTRKVLKETFGNVSGNEFFGSTINYNKEYFTDITGNELFQDTQEADLSDIGNTSTEAQNIVTNVNNMSFTSEKYKEILNSFISQLCQEASKINNDNTATTIKENINSTFEIIKNLSESIKNSDSSTLNLDMLYNEISSKMMNNNDLMLKEEFLINYFYLITFNNKATDTVKNTLNDEKDAIINNIKMKLREINCDIKIDYNKKDNLHNQVINILKNAFEKLIVRVAKKLDNNLIYADPNVNGFDSCTIKNIPLQKWNHVVVSVYNNIVDLYLNGKLVRSCILKGFPKPNTDNLYLNLNKGFEGQVAKTTFINSAITPSEVYDLYKMGPVFSEGFFDKVSDFFRNLI